LDADVKPRASVVQKILQKPRHEPETEGARESLKESRPAIPTPMLDVAFRDGRIVSFNYAYLRQVDFEPGDTLTLTFGDERVVRIEGRNLARHRGQIRLHRADEICEGTAAEELMIAEGEPHISRIEILEKEQEGSRDFGKRKGVIR
jgi:hypothetical protein